MNPIPSRPSWAGRIWLSVLRRWEDWRSRRYFQGRFQQPDPWQLETSDYESQRLQTAIAALGGRRFKRALELGCAEGQLTVQLAGHADEVRAVDISPVAVERARQRCAELGNVRVDCASIVGYPMAEGFDLVVATEVLYYLIHRSGDQLLVEVSRQIATGLVPGGVLVMTNWFEPGNPRTVGVESRIRQTFIEAGLLQVTQQVHSGVKQGLRRHFSLALFTRQG